MLEFTMLAMAALKGTVVLSGAALVAWTLRRRSVLHSDAPDGRSTVGRKTPKVIGMPPRAPSTTFTG